MIKIGQKVKVTDLLLDKISREHPSYVLKKSNYKKHIGEVIFVSDYIFTISKKNKYNVSFQWVQVENGDIIIKVV